MSPLGLIISCDFLFIIIPLPPPGKVVSGVPENNVKSPHRIRSYLFPPCESLSIIITKEFLCDNPLIPLHDSQFFQFLI
jgi:hypothetical protein